MKIVALLEEPPLPGAVDNGLSLAKAGGFLFVKNTKLKVRPLISIITTSYNSDSTIANTLQSVRDQNYQNIEHILIDGSSIDNTLDIIKSYPHVNICVSEKDNGMYDAINKGLRLATGDIIGILNSDDIYADKEVLSKVVTCFESDHADSVYADLFYVRDNKNSELHRRWRSGTFKRSSFYFGWMPPHPTFFVRNEIYKKVGSYNTSFKIAADYEMMLRILLKYRCSTSYLPEVLVKMRIGGASNRSFKNRLVANREDRYAWKLNNLKPFFFTLYLKPLRKVFQFFTKGQFRFLIRSFR